MSSLIKKQTNFYKSDITCLPLYRSNDTEKIKNEINKKISELEMLYKKIDTPKNEKKKEHGFLTNINKTPDIIYKKYKTNRNSVRSKFRKRCSNPECREKHPLLSSSTHLKCNHCGSTIRFEIRDGVWVSSASIPPKKIKNIESK